MDFKFGKFLDAFVNPAVEFGFIRIGVGISSGAVITGNIGSSKRMDYTAIGDGVNLSARLESITKLYGCDLVISEFTHKFVADEIKSRELDLIRVKGKTQPVRIYQVIGDEDFEIAPAFQSMLDRFNEGRRLYTAQDFDGAMGLFSSILADNPKDKSADLFLKRCEVLKQTPPGNDWDGVWTMTTK